MTFTITLSRGTTLEVDDETSVTDPLTGLSWPVFRNQALSRLLAQYQQDDALKAIVSNLADEAQELATAILDVIVTRSVDYAFGVALDMLGRVVGEPRNGRTDAVYQTWIKGRIRANMSRGRALDLIEVLQLVGAPVTSVVDTPPAGLYLTLGPVANDYLIPQYAGLANAARAGGVSLDFVYETDADGFIFDDDIAPSVAGATHGFGDDISGGVGGLLAGDVSF